MSAPPALSDTVKRRLKSMILELRRLLEDDLGRELARLGLDASAMAPTPVSKLPYLQEADRAARQALEAVLAREEEAAGSYSDAVLAIRREAAYTHLNRWMGLKCLELRGHLALDGQGTEAITCRPEFGDRPKWLWTLRDRESRYRFGQDAEERLWRDGLRQACAAVTREIGVLFDPADPYAQVRPSHQALRQSIDRLNELPEEAFRADELLGWVYQYFQTEEKARVFEEARTKKKKIAGADIIAVTQLYTERYMVDFLLQNSIGAGWMEMYPDSDAKTAWPYYVTPATPHSRAPKPLKQWTILDPCAGSGHFLVVAFDLLQQLYTEERRLAEAGHIPREWAVPEEEVALTILERNLYGIDIDPRAVQLASLALYLKGKEAGLPRPPLLNIVAADASFMQGLAWQHFLAGFEREPSVRRVLEALAESLKDIRELGSLLRPEVELQRIIAEEHKQWEAQVKRGAEQPYLFPELERPRQHELPFEEITDAAFWERMAQRVEWAIQGFLAQARQHGDLTEQVVAGEAQRGFAFLELCQRRYDVVCTNPPYMGSGMGSVTASFLAAHYASGKNDLYAAFILRCREWAQESGHIAMVTQQSWMFLRTFADLRALPKEKLRKALAGQFTGLLREASVVTLAHLGEHGFSDLSAAGAFVVLFTFRNAPPAPGQRTTALRAVGFESPALKAAALRTAIASVDSELVFQVSQHGLAGLPGSVLAYWLSEELIAIASSKHRFSNVAFMSKGLGTCHDARFVRYHWEVRCKDGRWFPLSKGGGYSRWHGLDLFVVDYEDGGRRIREELAAKFPYLKGNLGLLIHDPERFADEGLVYSEVARGSLGARYKAPQVVVGHRGPAIFPTGAFDLRTLAAVLNCRLLSFLYRTTSGTLLLDNNYLGILPAPSSTAGSFDISRLAGWCFQLKAVEVRRDPTERMFADTQDEGPRSGPVAVEAGCALRHTIEGIIEGQVFAVYGVSNAGRRQVVADTGCPAGWHPLVPGYDRLPELEPLGSEARDQLMGWIAAHCHVPAQQVDVAQLKVHLRKLYEAGTGFSQLGGSESSCGRYIGGVDSVPTSSGAHIPIPAETFLEELAQTLNLHPISIYWLLEEMRHEEGLVCPPELRRLTKDYFCVRLLRMLGHRWPMQDQYEKERGRPFLDQQWIDEDGIIALTPGTGEQTLIERLRRYLDAEFGPERGPDVEREAGMILGWKRGDEWDKQKATTLEAWFEREFFKRHVSQFKRRPIAWHLRSPRGAFQAIVYYHKFDQNRLALLRARYVRTLLDLRRRELAEAQVAGLLDRQALARAEALENEVADLQEFDERLRRLQEGRDREARIWCPWKAPQGQPLGWDPDINDGVRVNIAPLQRLGLLAADVLSKKDLRSLLAPEGRD